MKTADWNQWSVDNQEYLAAALNVLSARLQWHLENLRSESQQSEFPGLTSTHGQLEAIAASMTAAPAIEQLASVFGLSVFEKDILLLCAGVELDAGFAALVSEIQGSAAPMFSLALSALDAPHWSALSPVSALRFWHLIEVSPAQLITRSALSIDEQILYFLTGVIQLNERLIDLVTPVPLQEKPAPSQSRLADEAVTALSIRHGDAAPPVLQFSGADKTDIASMSAYISLKMGRRLFAMSAFAIPAATKEIAALARTWSREAALNNYMLLLDCSELDSADKMRLQSVIYFLDNLQGLIIINAEFWTPTLRRERLMYELQKPRAEEQLAIWKSAIGPLVSQASDFLPNLVAQFNLSTATIRKIGAELQSKAAAENDEGNLSRQLWMSCCRNTRPQVDDLAQRIEPVATWDDIVLPEAQLATLRDIAAQVRQRNKVYSEWGFGDKSSRGLGISALFSGESGTGKTMASEVLANELKLDLYKIDLSKVVNKYIGETEKNLKRIFDAAEDGGAILLFDEADALFGKRSDVKDSHDRYSNIEVSYLLQRMEAYRGLAILTTNMKNALDKAFMRRIRFVINFPFPDSMQRADIWQKVFPGSMPKQHLDYERLAKLTIPGGNIRNIAMNAAFAAADAGLPVQMTHILRAAKTEYDKIEKPLNNLELKAWQ